MTGQRVDHGAALPTLGCLVTAQAATCAVNRGTKGAAHALGGACQNVGRSSHAAADEHGLAHRTIHSRHRGMARPECARGALAMNEESAYLAVDFMLFLFACVVRNVVEQAHIGRGKNLAKGLAHQVCNDLAVGHGAIHGRAHGSQVVPARCRVYGRASQLALGQRNPVAASLSQHGLEIVGADLMAQAARAAVDAHHHLTGPKLVGRCDLGREDLDHLLHFQVVVARAQGTKLIALPLLRL